MEVIGFLVPWVLIGIGVIFVAFSGGPGAAREAYLTRGNRGFRVFIPLLYIALGIAIPALVMAKQAEREGATPKLVSKKVNDSPADFARGKALFTQSCASCHTLKAVNARGVTGPNLDKLGKMTKSRVMSAIKTGGTGQNRMPAGLLQGKNAEAVAAFVAETAGD
jgi:mono/diheme cytochrome c family protein